LRIVKNLRQSFITTASDRWTIQI